MNRSVCILAFAISQLAMATANAEILDVWIGTGSKHSQGIYHCTLNTDNGRLSDTTLAAEITSPGFLAMHPKGTHLYAVGALDGEGCVAAYRIRKDGKKSTLEFVNSIATGDGRAAHVAISDSGRILLTAQYGGGSVSVFSVNGDGSLNKRTQVVEHSGGSKVNPRRQASPHPHWVGFSPDNKFAFVPDLGMDKIVIYKVDAGNSKIEPHGAGLMPPGGGPRHMKFSTNGKWAYALNELHVSVTVFDYDAEKGTLTPKQTVNAVPKEQLAKEKFKSSSEIRVHPNGRFVYSANRGHDTITAFKVNQDTGELSVIEREHTRGATPRNFNLDPSGKWLIAGGQDSHNLSVFEVDQESGELAYNRSNVHAPSPICVLFTHE